MALTSLRAADHVGLTVPDLDAAVHFLVDRIGFEAVYAHAPEHEPGDAQVTQFARHPETRIRGIAMLRLGTLNLELFEFEAPDQRREVPRSSDWGGAHVAVYVDDLDAAVADLRAHDARVLGEPLALPGPEAGADGRFVFVAGPNGLLVELVTYPAGKAYEAQTDRRLHDPREEPAWPTR